jgi:hypothetical protein
MKKRIELINAIFGGIVKIIRAIKCKSACCKSSCDSHPEPEEPEPKTNSLESIPESPEIREF